MQLPSSVSSSNYRQAPIASNVQPNRPEKAEPSQSPAKTESASKPEQTQSPQQPSANFAAVDAAQNVELPSQDLATREQSASTGNVQTDQYRQIANEGASNAQAQDPSLFRIDVYV